MIEEMKFITVTGPKNDMDRVVSKYLSKHDIHYENALTELNETTKLTPFTEVNPYKEYLTKANRLLTYLDTDHKKSSLMDLKDAMRLLDMFDEQVNSLSNQISSMTKEIETLTDLLKQIEPFLEITVNLKSIFNFQYIKFRFGRFPKIYFQKFDHYIYNLVNSVFYECLADKDYVYGVYFVPASEEIQVDAIYTSMHFERIFIPDQYEGTPKEAYQEMDQKVSSFRTKISTAKEKITSSLKAHRLDILNAYHTIEHYYKSFDIRKLAALTSDNQVGTVFYILCGFMPAAKLPQLISDTESDVNVFIIFEDAQKAKSKPPTKLKNPALFRPFETFIQIYGMPAYRELDPTIFIALTYSLMFGMMFGDVGQGLLLVTLGYLLYKIKHIPLAGAISFAGLFSVFFGFMYGSFFGFEELSWLPALFMHPMNNVMTTLIISVAFGAILILVAMILNIINGAKDHDIERIFLDPSGVAGFVFYGGVIFLIVRIITGHPMPSAIILAILLGLPLIFMFFREPLGRFIEKEKKIFPESKIMYLLEGIVELFEILLSYITNTISFVRVGAFALSHTGMMGVVLSLSHVEGGNPNFIILILGNLLVVALEGLVVGIQVLRLQYYEMFSRFYHGTGKEFKPY